MYAFSIDRKDAEWTVSNYLTRQRTLCLPRRLPEVTPVRGPADAANVQGLILVKLRKSTN